MRVSAFSFLKAPKLPEMFGFGYEGLRLLFSFNALSSSSSFNNSARCFRIFASFAARLRCLEIGDVVEDDGIIFLQVSRV